MDYYNKWEKMGVLGFKSSREVPSELPDLISDEIEKESLSDAAILPEKEQPILANDNIPKDISELPAKKNIKDYQTGAEESKVILRGIDEDLDKEKIFKKDESNIILPEPPVQSNPEVKVKDNLPKESNAVNYSTEKSFFNNLQENLEKEIADVDSLEEWYESKFSSRDMLGDMRSYWEKQKTPSIMEALGKNFQLKISQKVQELQGLEREWQNTYFELIGKEEEIKDTEQELKSMLNEFVKICKHKKDSLENGKKEINKESAEIENKEDVQEEISSN